MPDVRLFDISGKDPQELEGKTVEVEKEVQTLIENNLEAFFAVRFLATEYSTGKTHSGRIDTLGLDENNSPVILEYKRRADENVITQGLYYLDWLMDHKSEFDVLAAEKLGEETEVDWSAPRLICVAGDYKKFDLHATNQINRNIDLVRYEQYGTSHILFELINSAQADNSAKAGTTSKSTLASDKVAKGSLELQNLWQEAEDYILSLSDDVVKVELKYVVAFRVVKNFAGLGAVPSKGIMRITVKVNPDEIELEEGFSRDLRGVGHWGVGDLVMDVTDKEGLEKAKPLIKKAYEEIK